ncbi:MAG: hypothetical protein JWO86_169 [Myxococcaceae bacterium]|nr:hypothetical protein [Myxococcaceae bacterium]
MGLRTLVWCALSAGLCAGALSVAACSELRIADVHDGAASDASDEASDPDGGTPSRFTIVQQTPDGGSLESVFGFAANDIYAAGENGTILHYDGASWTKGAMTTGALLAKVWGRAPNDVYAVGVLAEAARGVLMHNDGKGWIEEREFDDGLTAVWGTKDFTLVGGLNGKIYKKTATRDWYLLVTLEKNPFATPEPNIHPDDNFAPVVDALWGNDATHFGAACDLDTTVFYRDPSMWVPEYDPVNRKRRFRSVWGPPGASYNLFFGANYNGVWLVQNDIAMSLSLHEERDTPERVDQAVWGIWGTATDNVLFVGDKGRIMSWKGQGDVTIVPAPTTTGLSAVWGSSADDVWIVGDDMTILHGSMP